MGIIGLAAVLLGTSAAAQASVDSNPPVSVNPTLTTVPAEKSVKPLTVASIGPHPGCLVGAISKSSLQLIGMGDDLASSPSQKIKGFI